MAIDYSKITYSIGTSIELHCVEYWNETSGDYEIIGLTTITDMALMGLDFYTMHFNGVDQDDFYNQLLNNNVPIYIMKSVTRNPFSYIDTTDGIDAVTEYLYLADSMIDKNNTQVLLKRVHVTTNVNVGTYDKSLVTDKMESEFMNEMVGVLDDFSDKYRVEPFTKTIILQPEHEAIEEDRDYKEKRARLAAEHKAKIEAERKRLESLNTREAALATKESVLVTTSRQLQSFKLKLEEQERQLNAEKDNLERERQTIDLQYRDIAEKTAALNNRARIIAERERQLGIPNSNL